MKERRDTKGRRARLTALCKSLPEVEASGDPHVTFRVRKKVFAYYLYDHHGDGRIALWCKGAPGEQSRLVEENPRRFFVPPYVGPRDWVGVRLDLASVNWSQVMYLLRTAYRLTAPRALLRRLE